MSEADKTLATAASALTELATIRHELRTPINHIIGYSEMLQEEAAEVALEFVPDLLKIQRGGKELLKLINQYFDPEKIHYTKRDPHGVLHELRTPVNHIIGYTELLQEQAEDSGQMALVPDLQKIHQAATRWLALMEHYLLQFQGAPSRQNQDFETSFMTQPEAAQQTTPEFTPEASQQQVGTLLVVDDDAGNRDMLARRLRRQGYAVATAAGGEAALELLNKHSFDLVLLDMLMPGINGYEVLKRMKSHPSLRHIPVLMISALDEINDIVRCIEIGAEDYLSKPFNPVFLRARIGAALEKKRLRDQEQVYLRRIQEEQEKAERLLLNVLPSPIALRLKNGEESIADSFAEATVLFADLVGFTTFSLNISAADLVKRLNEIFCSFDRLAEEHGLEKIKTIGDAYMAVSGLPTPREDHAQAAAAMALAMQEELQRFNVRSGASLQMRIGLNSGPVIAGVIGARKFIYDLWGDTVNTASRMESHGRPGSVQVSQATFEKLKNYFDLESRGFIDLKGRGQVAAYWLLRPSTATERTGL